MTAETRALTDAEGQMLLRHQCPFCQRRFPMSYPNNPFPPTIRPRQFGLPHEQSKGVMWRS